MKNGFKVIVCILLAVLCACILPACNSDEELCGGGLSKDLITNTGPWSVEDITENPNMNGEYDLGMVSEGRLYFYQSKTEALLVDSNGSLTWLYSKNKSIFEGFETGDLVKVGHGAVMESYPGQTYISQIALIERGDVSSFSDEEWERLSGVFADGLER